MAPSLANVQYACRRLLTAHQLFSSLQSTLPACKHVCAYASDCVVDLLFVAFGRCWLGCGRGLWCVHGKSGLDLDGAACRVGIRAGQ